MDYKLEAVVLPVADVDGAKAFYPGRGWRLACAVIFGAGQAAAS
jgi:hypothetical protein